MADSGKLLRTQLLQQLIDRYKYKSYLEIGLHTGENFRDLVIDEKISVDPDKSRNATYPITSDEYFKKSGRMFDLIFIDGLHKEDYAMRDFKNSLHVLNEGGTIVMHDVLPRHRSHIKVEFGSNEQADVWKAVFRLHAYSHIKITVVDIETGMAIIQRGLQEPKTMPYNPKDLNWEFYARNRRYIYKIVDWKQFKKLYKCK